MNLTSPLARVRGLGSAKQGTEHFWQQRVTAILLAPLMLWLVISLLGLDLQDYGAIVLWMRTPLNTLLLLTLVVTACHHGQLGVQVVIEDYIHDDWQKVTCLIIVKFLAILAGLASILAILRVFLG
jgi:succinate dehydrogenase / fumarate reductase membrane anchor subunit